MPDHDPQKVAQLIEKQVELGVEARELLEHVGNIPDAKHYDVGANKVLVVLPGWSVLKNPDDYLVLSTEF